MAGVDWTYRSGADDVGKWRRTDADWLLTFSLRPWLTRIEQAIRKSLLAPGERNKYFAEFSIEGLLRADSAARAAFYSTMTQNGLMTRNEARQKKTFSQNLALTN